MVEGPTLLDVPMLSAAPARLAELPPSGAAVYVHLDLDVLDPSALPAVAVPTAGGVAPTVLRQALAALRASHEVVGVGITEYVPQLEHDPQVLGQVLAALGLTAASSDERSGPALRPGFGPTDGRPALDDVARQVGQPDRRPHARTARPCAR